jgi:hypothetical protein
MRQRIGLLARKDKAALFGARQRGLSVPVIDFMAFAFCHEFGGAMQPLFRLDHGAGREAIFAASVLAKFDQIGRIAHRAHDFVELLDAMAVPVREDSYIAPREGRLLLRDRVQPKRRIGDDPRAIAACDLAVHLRAVSLGRFALDAPVLNAMRGRADLVLGLQRDALRLQAAMVDPRVNVEFGQALIGELRPAFAPALDHLRAIPVPDLRAETVLVHRAHRQHDMGMRFGASILGHIPMHIEIGDHAPVHEFAPSEVAGQFDACASLISRGRANSTSRASWASLRISNASTSFQSRSRSLHASGAFSGSITSEWTTPRFLEKSWLRSSRSSRSRDAER